MVQKKLNTEDILKRMQKHKSSGGGGNYFSLKDGEKAIIRILPEVGNMEAFWQEVGTHSVQDASGSNVSIACRKFTTDGELECPLCQISEDAYHSGDKQTNGDYRVRRAYHMNIIVRKKLEGGQRSYDIKMWTPGVTVFEQLHNIIGDPDYGAIWDVEAGYDIKINREGEKLATTYLLLPTKDEKPLIGSKDVNSDGERVDVETILADTIDLSKKKDNLPSVEDIYTQLGISDGMDEDDFDYDNYNE